MTDYNDGKIHGWRDGGDGMTQIAELIARWQTDEGRPFKGSLIDMNAYNGDGSEPPENIGCMCAQGQVLHLVAGWTPKRLNEVNQSEADAATAKLLNISRVHAVLLRLINDRRDGAPAIVLADPGAVLGAEWSRLLDFWWHLDKMTPGQWNAAKSAAKTAAKTAEKSAAEIAAKTAAEKAAGIAAENTAWDATWGAALDATWASSEIQGARILRRDGKSFYFLRMFGFASPEDIPARPADYGVAL